MLNMILKYDVKIVKILTDVLNNYLIVMKLLWLICEKYLQLNSKFKIFEILWDIWNYCDIICERFWNFEIWKIVKWWCKNCENFYIKYIIVNI